MHHAPAERDHVAPAAAPGDAAQLWERLRASVERLATLGQQRLAPDALAQKLAARAKQLRQRLVAKQAGLPVVFLGFRKGRERYGIPIEDVVEVGQLEQFSPVPRTPPFIHGAVQWRGAILTLLDLGKLFALPESGIADLHVCVIVEAAGRRVAVGAGQMEEIFSVPQEQVKPAPELPGQIPSEWVRGVHDDNRLILNMERLLQDERLVNWRGVH
jgi:purine-binding chemotaxis protein CheW